MRTNRVLLVFLFLLFACGCLGVMGIGVYRSYNLYGPQGKPTYDFSDKAVPDNALTQAPFGVRMLGILLVAGFVAVLVVSAIWRS